MNGDKVASPAFEDDVKIIRAELKVMEGLCSCQSDEQHVLAAQEALTRLSARQAAFEAMKNALEVFIESGSDEHTFDFEALDIAYFHAKNALALAEAELRGKS